MAGDLRFRSLLRPTKWDAVLFRYRSRRRDHCPAPDSDFAIDAVGETPPPPAPSPLGAGYLILVVRELSSLSQRALARAIGTSQPTLATLETGNRVPTIRTLLRVADATGFELVIGLRRTNTPAPNPNTLRAQG